MKTLILSLTLFSLSHALMAQTPTEAQDKFKPHMLEHINPGCPENSICSEVVGQKRKKWLDLVTKEKKLPIGKLNQLVKTQGIPIAVFYKGKEPLKKKHILWDSACINHQKSDPKTYLALSILSSFKNVPQDIAVSKAYLIRKNKPLFYSIPRREFPLFIKGNSLYLNKEESGKYYGLKIDSKGTFSVDPPIPTEMFPSATQCPQELMEVFQKDGSNINLFDKVACYRLWNFDLKKMETILLGNYCP